MPRRAYITTSIPYVNAAPHVGHALEFVQADIIRRFRELSGDEVFLLTGTDENSLKNVRAAELLKITTQELCDRNSKLFRDLVDGINLKYDVFFRSSDKKSHFAGAQRLWELCDQAGDIYKKEYSGLYCVGCEAFYTEGELEDGLCPEHKTRPELVHEENYFFKLSKYEKRLLKLIESGEFEIIPKGRRNEILNLVKGGLEDISISRSVSRSKGWGVPVPGDPEQIMYVWIDALSSYINGIGFGTDEKNFKKWWPADLHVIGKGISRFHTIYWPAILLSAGLDLPRRVFVHGYLTVGGEKMSKSNPKTAVSPLDVLKKYKADELRYYMIRDAPSFEDGDFSLVALKDRTNKELLGDLGNLVSRVLTIAEKSKLRSYTGKNVLGGDLDLGRIEKHFSAMELHEALEDVMGLVRGCNRYINEVEPWKLSGKQLEEALYNLLESIRIIGILLYPFVPDTSKRICKKLGCEMGNLQDCKFRDSFKGSIEKGEHLFKKVE
ncbi:MAG: methionine--tRNA ligase [Candidatus Micrarchaeota archaeon]|nr:methionine--tRNA ligase [Candidatus Micrarchaeota archaeon]